MTGVGGPSEPAGAVDASAGGGSLGGTAKTVLTPTSIEGVVDLIRGAEADGHALAPAGLGTWPNSWCPDPEIVLSVSEMKGIGHYEVADLTLTAAAGTPWLELEAALEENGQWLPISVPGINRGTVGAAAACGGGGPLASMYGRMRDNVLGLTVVTGAGSVLGLGGRVVKNVAGFDLVRLMVGSRGSLGVITEVSYRVFPIPESDVTLSFAASPDAALDLGLRALALNLPVASIEVAGDAGLSIRVLGGRQEVDDTLGRLVAGLGSPDERRDGSDSRALHRQRLGWEGEADLVAAWSSRPSSLPAVLPAVERLSETLGGHAFVDVLGGLVRIKANAFPGELNDAAAAFSTTAAEVTDGRVELSTAPVSLRELVGTGDESGAARLSGALKAAFDPSAVLAPRCP